MTRTRLQFGSLGRVRNAATLVDSQYRTARRCERISAATSASRSTCSHGRGSGSVVSARVNPALTACFALLPFGLTYVGLALSLGLKIPIRISRQ